MFEDSELEFPFIIDSPTGSMDFDKREAVADIIPKVFNQMISFVQSAEVKRFADRFYDNPDAQYLQLLCRRPQEWWKCTKVLISLIRISKNIEEMKNNAF